MTYLLTRGVPVARATAARAAAGPSTRLRTPSPTKAWRVSMEHGIRWSENPGRGPVRFVLDAKAVCFLSGTLARNDVEGQDFFAARDVLCCCALFGLDDLVEERLHLTREDEVLENPRPQRLAHDTARRVLEDLL